MKAKELAKSICREGLFEVGRADKIVVGDGEKEVEKIVVCMVITPFVISEAKRQGADMIITHEPTFLHGDDECDLPFYEKKRQLLAELGVTVMRWHDSTHYGGVDLVSKSLVDRLGLAGDFDGNMTLCLENPITPSELAKRIGEALNIKHPRIVGRLDGLVKKIGLYLGARGDKPYHDMLQNDIELAVSGELSEWHAAEAVRDMAQMGMQKSIIILGHAGSEKEAMRDLADDINLRFACDGLKAFYIDCGELYSYID